MLSQENIKETKLAPQWSASTLPILRILRPIPILTENPIVLFFGIVLAKGGCVGCTIGDGYSKSMFFDPT
jgi:hypothetical protein